MCWFAKEKNNRQTNMLSKLYHSPSILCDHQPNLPMPHHGCHVFFRSVQRDHRCKCRNSIVFEQSFFVQSVTEYTQLHFLQLLYSGFERHFLLQRIHIVFVHTKKIIDNTKTRHLLPLENHIDATNHHGYNQQYSRYRVFQNS